MIDLSVIICTHNPDLQRLARVLDALRKQSLKLNNWELLIVDNNSNPPLLQSSLDVGWHPNFRILFESDLGLTAARLKGIAEAQAPLLVFIDDDNLPHPDYLENCKAISNQFPQLGCWGAGSIEPLFEQPPAAFVTENLYLLSVRTVPQVRWANLNRFNESVPYGAGLCIRDHIAKVYREEVAANTLRSSLDRRGKTLTSGGDLDLALTACDQGFGTGVFPELRIDHLIPAYRCTKSYLVRVAYGLAYSSIMLDAIRGTGPCIRDGKFANWLRWWLQPSIVSSFRKGLQRRIRWSTARGNYDAIESLRLSARASTSKGRTPTQSSNL